MKMINPEVYLFLLNLGYIGEREFGGEFYYKVKRRLKNDVFRSPK